MAYQGDPETGKHRDGLAHEHHIWHADKVKALVANQDEAVAFFCRGSRNFPEFIDLFDGVFVLEVDLDTLNRRLDERMEDEWGGKPKGTGTHCAITSNKGRHSEKWLYSRRHRIGALVVDEIVRQSEANE